MFAFWGPGRGSGGEKSLWKRKSMVNLLHALVWVTKSGLILWGKEENKSRQRELSGKVADSKQTQMLKINLSHLFPSKKMFLYKGDLWHNAYWWNMSTYLKNLLWVLTLEDELYFLWMKKSFGKCWIIATSGFLLCKELLKKSDHSHATQEKNLSKEKS